MKQNTKSNATYPPKGSFPKSEDKIKTSKEFDKAGPSKEYNIEECDCDGKCDDCKKNSTKDEKKIKESINNFMSNKSLFERLFEEVMSDEQALGIPSAEPTEPSAETFGGEEETEVTLTLDKELAKKLHDLLGSVLGTEEEMGEEESEEEGGEEEGGEEEGEEEGGYMGEASEIEELKGTEDLTQAAKKEVNAPTLKPTGGKAQGNVTGATPLAPKTGTVNVGKQNVASKLTGTAFPHTGKAVTK